MVKNWLMLGVLAVACGVGPMGCMNAERGGASANGEEAGEVKVAFASLPAPVQATFSKEAQGVAIREVDQESDGGKTVYEADAVIGGTNYEIVVDPDGNLVSKKVDDESAEKGEKGEKEEQGEHKD
ncbi:MAG: PepSY domain-containing protein [Phycisphaerae bacterium]